MPFTYNEQRHYVILADKRAMRFTLEVLDPKTLDLFTASEGALKQFGATKLVEKYAATNRAAPDGFLTVFHTPKTSTRYVCQAKRQINSQILPSVIAQLKDAASKNGMKPMLLTEYVNPNLSETLRSQEVAYIDQVGNARLIDPPLFIWLQGFKPLAQPNRTSRAFHPTGLRLIALLLAKPEAINWPYRKLAEQAGLSLGSTARILSDLRSLGFINLAGLNENALIQRCRLFEHWEFGYLSRLRPTLKPQTFRQATTASIDELLALIPLSMREDVLLGGELAASVATGYLRPQSAVLHLRPHRPIFPLLRDLRLVPDPHGNVTLIEQIGGAATWQWEGIKEANLIHPLLVHAELLQGQADDRLRETASLIFDKWLKPVLNDGV